MTADYPYKLPGIKALQARVKDLEARLVVLKRHKTRLENDKERLLRSVQRYVQMEYEREGTSPGPEDTQ